MQRDKVTTTSKFSTLRKFTDNCFSSRYDFIDFLKFFAIVMITNSHFKPIYSGSLVQLGIGGAFGCALFFFCSGFTMAYAKKEESFWQYFFKRIRRIYPSLWIFYLITCNFKNPLSWVLMDGYWFLQAIVVFYALFYFVRKHCISYLPWIIIGLLTTAVATFELTSHSKWLIDLTYQPYFIHWMYYFAIMLIGAYIRIRGGGIIQPTNSLELSYFQ